MRNESNEGCGNTKISTKRLCEGAFAKRSVVEAFVLTFKEGSEYDSVNYLWFENTYENFMYVDRVVVSLQAFTLVE